MLNEDSCKQSIRDELRLCYQRYFMPDINALLRDRRTRLQALKKSLLIIFLIFAPLLLVGHFSVSEKKYWLMQGGVFVLGTTIFSSYTFLVLYNMYSDMKSNISDLIIQSVQFQFGDFSYREEVKGNVNFHEYVSREIMPEYLASEVFEYIEGHYNGFDYTSCYVRLYSLSAKGGKPVFQGHVLFFKCPFNTETPIRMEVKHSPLTQGLRDSHLFKLGLIPIKGRDTDKNKTYRFFAESLDVTRTYDYKYLLPLAQNLIKPTVSVSFDEDNIYFVKDKDVSFNQSFIKNVYLFLFKPQEMLSLKHIRHKMSYFVYPHLVIKYLTKASL